MQHILQRRQALLSQIANQRSQMARAGARLSTPLGWVDQVVEAIRYLRAHPLILTAAAGLLAYRRGRLLAVPRLAWRIWKGYRAGRSFISKWLARN